MGRSRKCNWKRKLKKAEKKKNLKPISGFDYYKLNLDSKFERNKKWWDEMYRQYKEFGSNIIFTKSRRGNNSGIIMEMAVEFAKRSGSELIHVKRDEINQVLKGARFDLYDGVDPELMTRVDPEQLSEYWDSVFPKNKDKSLPAPIIYTAGWHDTSKGFNEFWQRTSQK